MDKPKDDRLEAVETHTHRFVVGKNGGDVALKLFEDVDELFESYTPEEERKVMRKVDLLILPYLTVCYIFFFVSRHYQFASYFGHFG